MNIPLWKHAYSNILKISPPKTENCQKNKDDIVLYISAQNMDCEYSLDPPRRLPLALYGKIENQEKAAC